MLHLIFTEDAWVVTRKARPGWRELQAQFAGYQTSLDFQDEAGLLDWWQEEYSGPVPQALLDFLASGSEECTIR